MALPHLCESLMHGDDDSFTPQACALLFPHKQRGGSAYTFRAFSDTKDEWLRLLHCHTLPAFSCPSYTIPPDQSITITGAWISNTTLRKVGVLQGQSISHQQHRLWPSSSRSHQSRPTKRQQVHTPAHVASFLTSSETSPLSTEGTCMRMNCNLLFFSWTLKCHTNYTCLLLFLFLNATQTSCRAEIKPIKQTCS
jgi:hypothetical protein